MPLDKSNSKAAVSRNIETLLGEGKPRKQAIAIALDIKKRASKASGGRVNKDTLKTDTPRRTPSHSTKSHIVKTKVNGKDKIIRFGEQGASTAGAPKAGESAKMKAKRKSFKSRHAKNIAKGKSSAAYWANRVKWDKGGSVDYSPTTQAFRNILGQGTLFGWGDEGEAWLRSKLGKGNYEDIVADIRAKNEAYAKNNPIVSTVGEIGGALPTMIIPGLGAVRAGKIAGAGLKALNNPYVRAAGVGAAEGAVAGAGYSKEGQRLEGAIVGGVLGAPAGAAGYGAIKAGGAGIRKLKDKRNEGRIRKAAAQVPDDSAYDPLRARLKQEYPGMTVHAERAPTKTPSSETPPYQRKVSPVGLYSYGEEATSRLPQAKGQPQQFAAMLKKAGVKDDELNEADFMRYFEGRPSITRKEVGEYFQSRAPEVKEHVRNELYSSQAWSGDLEFPPALYSKHITPLRYPDINDSSSNYREIELLLPPRVSSATTSTARYDELNNIAARRNLTDAESDEMLAIEQAEWEGESGAAGEDFVGGHFPEKNLLVHLRMQDVPLDDKGKKALHVHEIQSDWGQRGKKRGFKEKGRDYAAELQKLHEEIRELDNSNPKAAAGWSHGTYDLDEVASRGWVTQRIKKHKRIQEIDKIIEDSLPTAPFVTETSKWTDLALKRALFETAKGGYEKIIFSRGSMHGGGGNIQYYDEIVPQRLKKLLKKLDPKARIGRDKLQNSDYDTWVGEVPSVTMTPKMREKILEGLPMFGTGGLVKPFIQPVLKLARDIADREGMSLADLVDRYLFKDVDRAAAHMKAEARRKKEEIQKFTDIAPEGKIIKATQADRTSPELGGGPSFSIMGIDLPDFKTEKIPTWAVMDKGAASRILGQTSDDVVWTTALGGPEQLFSNKKVFGKIKNSFFKNIDNLNSELEGKLNKNIKDLAKIDKAFRDAAGNPLKITDKTLWNKANKGTFPMRRVIADLVTKGDSTEYKNKGFRPTRMGGKTKLQKVVDWDEIIKTYTDPDLYTPPLTPKQKAIYKKTGRLEGIKVRPTYAAGNRLFTVDDASPLYRPDIHPAFPTILTGRSLAGKFESVPHQHMFRDWHSRLPPEKQIDASKWGMNVTRGIPGEGLPSQFIDDKFLRFLQDKGYKEGGLFKNPRTGKWQVGNPNITKPSPRPGTKSSLHDLLQRVNPSVAYNPRPKKPDPAQENDASIPTQFPSFRERYENLRSKDGRVLHPQFQNKIDQIASERGGDAADAWFNDNFNPARHLITIKSKPPVQWSVTAEPIRGLQVSAEGANKKLLDLAFQYGVNKDNKNKQSASTHIGAGYKPENQASRINIGRQFGNNKNIVLGGYDFANRRAWLDAQRNLNKDTSIGVEFTPGFVRARFNKRF